MWVGNSELTHQVDKIIAWVDFPVKRLVVGLIVTVVFTVSVSIGLLKVWEYAQGIKFKSYYDFISISLTITFLISFFLHGREFLLQWKKTAVEAERYQKESIIAQYESLRSQVNPHFLFNSLNVLTNLVYSDQDKAARFIKKMSEVYRYVLDTRARELVDIKDELVFVESYYYLQQIRFGDNLKINNQLVAAQGRVVPLALQILIENAVKHNEISTEHPLEITMRQERQYIIIENTIRLRSNPLESNSGVGLENIQKRYEFLTSDPVGVIQDNGTFKVQVPLLMLDDHD
jgi:LytS/YehU family sensor histidine kinase